MRLVHTDVRVPARSLDLIREFLDSGADIMEIETEEPSRTVYYRLQKYTKLHPDLGVEVNSVKQRVVLRRVTPSASQGEA